MRCLNILLFSFLLMLIACKPSFSPGTFGYDAQLLEKLNPVVLEEGNSKVLVVGEFQGRILTSTARGDEGKSYGFFRRSSIEDESYKDGHAGVSGESRMWFGPEAGSYSVFFNPGVVQGHETVRVPAVLDTVRFSIINQSKKSITCSGVIRIQNYAGTWFDIDVTRKVSIFSKGEIESNLSVSCPKNIVHVGFEARTILKNMGDDDWTKDKGLLSIWDISAFIPDSNTVVVIPVSEKPDSVVEYFSALDSTRLKITSKHVFYKADANYMNKMGVKSPYVTSILGSYSPNNKLLTIMQFKYNNDSLYVNSRWGYQSNPYYGDAINVFNDGVMGDIGPFGPLYEMETSSNAKELEVGEELEHWHRIYHFEGDEDALNEIAVSLLGIGVNEINKVF